MSSSVGKNLPRIDAFDKVTGRANYIDDISYPDMWFGVVARASTPRGLVRSIKFKEGFDWSKVVTADYKDIPGRNIVAQAREDHQALVEKKINHKGEAIVLIAAPTKELADRAKKNIVIEYENLPAVFTILESRSKKEIIYGEDNVICSYFVDRGDVRDAFRKADFIVEGEYRTGHQEQAYIETQGIVAIPRKDGGFTIHGSLQCPYYVLKAMKVLLNLEEDKINVKQAVIGGAFGGKEDYPSLLAGYAVLLAKKCKRPVKIVYDRHEDILYTTKRHPSIVRHKTGVTKDGRLVVMDIDVAFDGGAYATLSPVVLARGLLHAWGPYRCPNVRASAACFATNTVPTGAFRGFGAPQALFAIESQMDAVAEKIGISPIELRKKNLLRVGDETATGQILKESVGAMECLEKAVRASGVEDKQGQQGQQGTARAQVSAGGGSAPGGSNVCKGVGISLFMHGAGFTGSGEAIMKGRAAIVLEKDGTISILTGCTDMGQGAHTVLPQIVADSMNIPLKFVRCAVPDTAVVPDSGPTVASRTTMVIGKVLMWCCDELKKDLQVGKSAGPQVTEKRLKEYAKKNGPVKIEKHYDLPPGIVWEQDKFKGDAYPAYAWGCNIAEVEVDNETFEIKLKKLTAAYDIGRAINPMSVEGQMEGGALQAVGYGLLEEMKYNNGSPLNNRFQSYIIPTIKDAPEFETIIVEDKFSWGPYGAKGLGELPLDGAAPAIANAVFNATGVRIRELPITSERIMQALKSKTSAKN